MITDEQEKYLRTKLEVSERLSDPVLHDSVMTNGVLCGHDDAFLCKCRLDWIINYLKTS